MTQNSGKDSKTKSVNPVRNLYFKDKSTFGAEDMIKNKSCPSSHKNNFKTLKLFLPRISNGVKLKRNFYTGNTFPIARKLLGKYIVRVWRGKKLIGKIVETEAYIGPEDKASHAYLPPHLRCRCRGVGKRTPRNLAEYLVGGHIYIYLVYGMYWQLNISTGQAEKPECVLIRALEPIAPVRHEGVKILANGPGKLCRWLKLNKSFYGEDVTKSKRIWLEDRGIKIKKSDIVATSRIGIDYAGPIWSKKPWRFYIKNNPFVSKF